jgi:predicted PurR-regulated permease PerM
VSDTTRPVLLGVALAILAVALWALRDVVMLVGFAALLAYALDPVVVLIERIRLPRLGHIPRGFASAIVMLSAVALLGWSIGLAVPRILEEATHFLSTLPQNLDRLAGATEEWSRNNRLAVTLGIAGLDLRAEATRILSNATSLIGPLVTRLVGNLGTMIGYLLTPVLAFYLLAEGDQVQSSVLGFVPSAAQSRVTKMFSAIDRALRSYVRGQAVVCLVMGTVTGAVLAMLGFPVALLLGLIVGLAEVIPFLGFWIAAVAILIAGATGGAVMAIGGVVAYTVINQMIAIFVTPRLMSRHMKMHPFVVTVSILAGAQLFGAPGAILALPAAAALQSVIQELAPHPGPSAAKKNA